VSIMIHNIIFRVFVITIASFLINVLITDGILSNLKSCQIEFQILPYNCTQIRYNIQILFCICLVFIVFYLIYFLCFKNFLRLSSPSNYYEDDSEEDDKASNITRLIFFKIIPVIFLILIGIFFIFLVLSRHVYAPPSNLYHISPANKNLALSTNVSSHLTESFKNLFRLKKRFLFSNLRSGVKENILTTVKDLKKRPELLDWELIRLTDAEKYELRLRYLKFVVLTGLTVSIYILLLLRLNLCTMCS